MNHESSGQGVAFECTDTGNWRRRSRSACYRFGDGILEIESEYLPLLETLRQCYGGCAEPNPSVKVRVRCTVQFVENQHALLVTFHDAKQLDLMSLALGLLQHPVSTPRYSECVSHLSGWRAIGATSSPARPIIVIRGNQAIVDLDEEAPDHFLPDLFVTPVLSLQRELLFVHAASVGIRGAGILLIGPTATGKTTTALTLASRGHGIFGDDMAAIRTQSCEMVPFLRAANIRPGPHGQHLDSWLENRRFESDPLSGGALRLRVPVDQLFPKSASSTAILRSVFFLNGFGNRPSVIPFTPSLDNLTPLSLNITLLVSWGISPERRLMQFLVFMKMLSKMRCHFLTLGSPEETADLVEATTEAI